MDKNVISDHSSCPLPKFLRDTFEIMESQDDGVSWQAETHCEGCKNLFESDVFGLHETLRDWPATQQDILRFSDLSDLVASASMCATCKYFLEVVGSDELLHSQILSRGSELVIAPSRAPYAVYRDNSPDAKVKCLWAYRIDITLETDNITYARRGTPSILPLAFSAGSLFQARQISEAADLGLAQKWLSICKGCHGTSCEPAEWKAIPGLQFRLVDVKRKCVVPAPVGCTYIALSYVWGDPKPLLLVKDNYVRLTTDDGLAPSQDDVPQVFLDAMKVSEAIGCQYIWIDAICILQDDEGDRTVQIENMRSIYSCAGLTIVSDSSNAATGLPCLQHRSRTTSQMLYHHGQLRVTNVLPNLHHSLSYFQWRAEDRPSPWKASGPRLTSPWESRGWTSKRRYCLNDS
jgi:Heterokaryon incompatibility protein (HET)